MADAIDSIAGCQREQRTDHQEKCHETRQHIDLDTKNGITPGFSAFVAYSEGPEPDIFLNSADAAVPASTPRAIVLQIHPDRNGLKRPIRFPCYNTASVCRM
ncbi:MULTISPECIES: hypothetical protein [Pandoraea]|uniref:hypothetical protein n=1 Tax=Pandoraea TaxID=93217 RepID=UPI00143C6591|nr:MULTISPECIES: hypothetical protein [Pandoraea]